MCKIMRVKKITRLTFLLLVMIFTINCHAAFSSNEENQSRSFKGHMFFVWNDVGGYYFSYHPGVDRLVERSEIKTLKVMNTIDVSLFFMENIYPNDEIDVICIERPDSTDFLEDGTNIMRSCDDIVGLKERLLRLANERNAIIDFRKNNKNMARDGF